MGYNKSLNDIYRGDEAVGTRSCAAEQNAFFNRVYGWMFGALALTAAVAYFVAGRPDLVKMIFGKPILFFGLIIAQFLLVIGISSAINRITVGMAVLGFAVYSALNGVIFSSLFLVYTSGSLALTFGATGLTFGVTSLIGYVTKRDLSGMRGVLMMGLIGFLIGTVINMFWANSMLYWMMTYLGLAVFIGLTAYDTNKLRQIANTPELAGGTMGRKLALLGALTLYLDFINLFLLLLRIFGGRRD